MKIVLISIMMGTSMLQKVIQLLSRSFCYFKSLNSNTKPFCLNMRVGKEENVGNETSSVLSGIESMVSKREASARERKKIASVLCFALEYKVVLFVLCKFVVFMAVKAPDTTMAQLGSSSRRV